jgi:hypothetical protein
MVEGKELVHGKFILVEWGVEKNLTRVEWTFTARTRDIPSVSITQPGFDDEGDKIVERTIGSASVFELVLAGLKAYLDHGIKLNLIEDRYPGHLVNRSEMEISAG